MACVIFEKNRSDWLDQIIKLKPPIQSEQPDELLYGRAGYLHTLLFLKKFLPDTDTRKLDALIYKVQYNPLIKVNVIFLAKSFSIKVGFPCANILTFLHKTIDLTE